jgi:hypothetical protein
MFVNRRDRRRLVPDIDPFCQGFPQADNLLLPVEHPCPRAISFIR